MEKDLIKKAKDYAQICHDNAGCTYGEHHNNYMMHLEDVANIVKRFKNIFKSDIDYINTLAASYAHDTIEDAQQTFNNVKHATNEEVAKIVLAVTDVPAENRLMRHLLTMGKTVKDHRAIILKLCDMYANASYSKLHKSSMFNKYLMEYEYRKPIFKEALSWYKNLINQESLDILWIQLDDIHNQYN